MFRCVYSFQHIVRLIPLAYGSSLHNYILRSIEVQFHLRCLNLLCKREFFCFFFVQEISLTNKQHLIMGVYFRKIC